MLKPLELPWRVRLWHFIRGLLFYNTVYWKRASDGLKPPTLSREERRNHQPERNLEIIRPREHPRAKLSVARGGQVSLPSVVVPNAGTELPEGDLPSAEQPASGSPEYPPGFVDAAEEIRSEVIVKRRRYRRRHNKVQSSRIAGEPDSYNAGWGFFSRLFGRKKHR